MFAQKSYSRGTMASVPYNEEMVLDDVAAYTFLYNSFKWQGDLLYCASSIRFYNAS